MGNPSNWHNTPTRPWSEESGRQVSRTKEKAKVQPGEQAGRVGEDLLSLGRARFDSCLGYLVAK